MPRHRTLQVLVVGAAALTVGAAIGLAAFELQVVRPGLTAIRAALAAGAPAERAPPDVLLEMLMRAHHRELAPAAVRLLRVDRQQRHTGLRLGTQLGLVVMLPLHLSERELAGFVLAQSLRHVDAR